MELKPMNIKFGTRKINKTNNSAVIYIPKLWMNSNELKTGATVWIEMDENGRLIIEPDRSGVDDR
jgi:antitoxin component of MazEF toxin-antitoxin module